MKNSKNKSDFVLEKKWGKRIILFCKKLIFGRLLTGRKSIPVESHFFSWKDFFVKFVGVCTILLLLVTAYFTISDSIKNRIRDEAYYKIMSFGNIKDDDSLNSFTENVERFLDNLPSLRKDSRESLIKDIYTMEFHKWLRVQDSKDEKIIREQFDKYRKITDHK